MKYGTAAGFRAALLEHLRVEADRTGTSPEQLRKRVVFERLLARLFVVAPDRWTLKGAIGLALRLRGRIRTTRDVDLLGPHTVDAATEDLIAAQRPELDDYFNFTIGRAASPARQRASARFHVTTEIGGIRFDEAVLDVEVQHDETEAPEMLESHLLAFADVPAVLIRVVPVELQIADKVHAYTRPHGRDQTEASTRPKDLADLFSIATQLTVDAAKLRQALRRVFRARRTHPLPASLPAPPRDWGVPFRRHAAEADLAVGLDEAYAAVAAFLAPVLDDTGRGEWDPVRRVWRSR